MKKQMKKFTIREVETVKATSAMYDPPWDCPLSEFLGWLLGSYS